MTNRVQPDVALPKKQRIRVYTAILNQTGTNAPTAIVYQNTLGYEVIWTRIDVGHYKAAIETEAGSNNATVDIATNRYNMKFITQWAAGGDARVFSFQGGGPTSADNGLQNTLFEIKIYEI